ncbi:MAG: helix-turn-helix domain-containing protein, partial [bacterium]
MKTKRNILILSVALFGTVLLGVVVLAPQRVPTAHVYLIGVTNTYVAQPITALTATIASTVWAHIDPLTRVAMVGESVAETNATAQFEAINTLLHIAISKVSHAQSKTLAQIQILSNVIHARTQAFVAGLFRVSTETYAPLRVAAAQNFQQNKYPLPSENMLAVQLVAGAKNLHQALFANASSFAFTGTPETHALDAHSLAGSAPLGGPSLVAVAAAGAGVVSDLVLPVMHNFVTSAVLPLTRVAMVGESVAETNATAQFEAINTLLHIAISKVSHAQSKTLAQIQILSNVIHARTQAFVAGLFRVSTETYAPLRVAAAQNFQQNKYPLPSENMLAVQLVAGAKNLHQALFANASSFAFTGTPETHALDAHSLAGSAPLGGPSLVAVAAAGAGVVSDLVLPVMHNFVTSAVLSVASLFQTLYLAISLSALVLAALGFSLGGLVLFLRIQRRASRELRSRNNYINQSNIVNEPLIYRGEPEAEIISPDRASENVPVPMLSAREVARLLGCTQDYVANLCRTGKLDASMVEGVWLVRASSIKNFIEARDRAKQERSEALMEARKREIREYAKTHTPLRYYVQKLFSKRGTRADMGLVMGSVLLFGSVLLAAHVAGQNQIVSQNNTHAPSAAIGKIASPFFGFGINSVSLPSFSFVLSPNASVASVGFVSNIFSDVLHWFAPHTAQVAENTESFSTKFMVQSSTAPVLARAVPQGAGNAVGTVIEQKTYPVVERIVERTTTVSGVTAETLDTKLANLRDVLRGEIHFAISNSTPTFASGGVANNIAVSQRVDQLSGTTISNPTISGGSISGASLSGTSLNIQGNTVFSGDLSVANLSASGALTVSGTTTLQSIAPSTLLYNNASKQIAAAFVGNGLTFSNGTLATSFGTTTANTFTALQQFNANASTTQLSATAAYFGGTATSTFTSQGWLGIGTTSPYSILSISNSATTAANTPLFSIASTTGGNSTSTLMTVLANGNIGIGTTSPQWPLHVWTARGDIGLGSITTGAVSTDAGLTMTGNGTTISALFTEVGGKILSYGINVPQITTRATSSSGGIFRLDTRTGGASLNGDTHTFVVKAYSLGSSIEYNALLVDFDSGDTALSPAKGLVGIGNTSPTAQLHVKGNTSTAVTGSGAITATNASTAVSGAGTTFTTDFSVGDAIKIGTSTVAYTIATIASNTALTLATNYIGSTGTTLAAYKDPNNLFAIDNGLGTNRLTVTRAGNFGVGTSSPWGQLSVNPNGIAGPSFVIGSSTATNFVVTNTGNVGIGTAAPGNLLQINDGGTGAADSELLNLKTSYNSNGSKKSITWRDIASGNTTGQIDTRYNGTTVDMVFGSLYNNGYNSLPILTVKGNGNVGIGTTSPWGKLSVTGAGTGTGVTFAAANSSNSPLFTVLDNGTVGVGTGITYTSSNYGMLISRSLEASTTPNFTSMTAGSAQGEISDMAMYSTFVGTGDSGPRRTADIVAGFNGGAWLNEYLAFGVGFNSSTNDGRLRTTEKMRITAAGNVGIGTTIPSQKLDVAGFINTDQYSGYKQAGNTILVASTTFSSLFVGAGGNTSYTGASNVGVGGLVMSNLTTGNTNVGVGYQALQNATSSNNNVAIGYQALIGSATVSGGGQNTGVGFQALSANTSGVQNVGIGYQALQSNTTGSFNAGISTGALQLNSTGNQNSAFGWRALTAVTTGYNTAMGGQTAAAVTTGSATSAFGALALFRNTTGSNNTAMGAFAAQNNALAVDTVTVGEGAAFGNAGNYSNSGGTIVGTRAGFNFATSSDYNTFLGYQSGYLNTSGFNNIFIGPQINTVGTGYITTGANNIGLGFNTLFPSATANNQLNIGNFIFGTLPATTSNSSFSLPTSGSLGVGTTSPYATLSVHANNGSTNTTLFAIGSSTASATTTLFSVDNTGKVAVGDAASGSIYQGINAGLATQATTTIVGNTALGFNAMQTATSSTYVTAIGYRALANLNDCAALAGAAKCLLTAVGTNALFANTTGYWNTAVGAGAAQNNTTGNQNVALGSNALQANTIGSGNMAIGFASLASNISGNGNTAVGGQALQNTTASSNAAIGQYAGIFNTTGSGNSFLGTNSGEASLVATDFNSTIDTNMTFVGMLSSRDGNVIASTSALTNGTAIGYKARVGASNTLALGGLGVNAVNVGIGSSTPFAQLSLHANAGSTNTTLFAIGSSTASATSTLFSIANTGTVTTNLSSGLVANNTGSLYSFATSSLYGSVAANTVLTNANGTAGTPAFTATSTFFGTGVGGTVLTWNNGVPQWVASTTYANGTGITTSFSAGQLTITNAGLTSLTQNGGGSAQTGAITFATSSALSFNGLALGSTITNSGGTFTFGNNLSGTLNNTGLTNSTIGATSPGATLSFGSAASLGSTFTADLNLANANIWSGLQQFSSGLTAYASSTIGNGTQNGGLTISGGATTTGNAYFAGNVGVGTTSPSFNFKLDVSGKLRSFSYLIGIGPDLSLEPVAAGQSALTSWHALQLVGFKNSPVDYTPSNVGIGADAYGVVVPMQSTTAAGLAILGFASQTANYFEITSSANKATLHGDIFNVASNGNVGIATTSPYAKLSVHANNGDTNTTLFAIASSTATATTTLFTVTNAGNVGIGTTSPAFPLSVSGTSAGTAGPRFVSSNTLGTGITLENTSSNKAWHIITGGTGNSEGSGALYFNSPSIASPIIIGAGGNLGVGLTPSSSGAGQLNVGASATIGGSDSRGVLTVQKNSTTQFAANTDPTDTGRYFVMENTEANQAAAGQYANVTLQLAPTLNVGTPGVGNGRVLSDIRAVRQVASSSDMAFMFSAFGNDHVYRDYFQVSSSTNWFLGNLQVGGVGAVASTLAANGNATIGSGYTTTAAPTNGLLVQGNVGIGTTSPFANLSVNGTGYFGGNLTSTNLTATGTLAVSGLASFAGNASTTALSVFNNAYFGATATSTFTSQGWLGIGTTSPFANLSIHANSGSTNTTLFAIASSTATATTTLFSVSNTGTVSMNTGITGGQNFTFSGTSPNNTANITTASNLNIAWAGAGALNMLQGVTNRFNISSAGLVGISVASPSYNLDVAGNGHFTTGLDAQYLVATSSSIASIFNGGFLSNASSTIGNGTQNGGLTISGGATTTGNAYFAGNVGIGTTSPTNKLGVNGYIDVSATGGYKFDGNKFIYASSTNFSTVMGIGAGTGLDATSTPLYSTAIGYNALHGVALTGTTYNNTAVGYQALLSNTSGAFNNAIGTNALSNNTSGTNNTAMGFGALSGVTTGGGNFGMGVNTNQNNQAGFSNVGIGNYSVGGGNGIGTNSNNDNIGIGNAALTLLTTGNRNIGFGSSVGATISTGSNNIFVGFKTASTTATGSNNIALGYDIALPSINGSNQLNIGNAIFGTGISGEGTNLSPALIGIGTTTPGSMLSVAGDIYASGFFNTSATTGGFKIDNQILLTASSTSGLTLGGIGAGSALLATTTVNGNTGFGYQAMNVATSSTKSTAIGYRALANLNDCATASGYPSGCALTAVGWQALANNTIGIWNTAVGASALQSNTTGATNNAFGTSALGSNTTGGGNQGIGFQALNLNTTGNGNTAVGTQALSTLTGNHSNNLAFGQYSAIYSTSGDNDIFIGNQAGLGGINQLNDTNSVKDTNVIFIGVNSSRDGSGLASTSVMNNSVAIGNASRVGASNSMALGGLGANAVNVGIGSSTPYAQLSVHANNGSTNTTLFAIASSTASATTTLFSISNSGSALQTLDAAAPYGLNIVSPTGGNTYINLARSVGGSDFSVGAFGITNIRGGGGSASLNVFSSSNTVVGEVILGNGASQTADLQQWKNNGVTLAEITAGGNVGIGTTSPFATLSVNGTGYFGGNLTSTNLTATGTLSVLTAASIASTTLTGSTLLTNATSTNFFATVASSTNL